MTATVEIPRAIACTFHRSSRSYCGQPATTVVRERNYAAAGATYHYAGRCRRHAAVDANRTYGAMGRIEFTPEIVAEMMAEIAETNARKDAERQARVTKAQAYAAAHRERRALEAERIWMVERRDQDGDPDWDASRAAGSLVLKPSTPAWVIFPQGEGEQAWGAMLVAVERKPDLPVTVEVRGSKLDVNAAIALSDALSKAIAVAIGEE